VTRQDCAHKGCDAEGIHYRDFGGPAPNIRFYCDEHVSEGDRELHEAAKRAELRYQRSVVKNLIHKLATEYEKLCALEQGK
jgi:hypothetical protein